MHFACARAAAPSAHDASAKKMRAQDIRRFAGTTRAAQARDIDQALYCRIYDDITFPAPCDGA